MERVLYCPVCEESTEREECERFGMCLDCFIEELVENVRDNIIRDFLAEYGHLLREYIWENYF